MTNGFPPISSSMGAARRCRYCHKLLESETGNIVFSRDVTWHHPDAPLILSATAVGNPPAAPPKDIYVPMPTHVPPAPAPVPPAPAPAPSPTAVPAPTPTSASTTPLPPTTSQPPPPILPRVGRELQHEGHDEIPGWTCGQTQAVHKASREYTHHHGLLSTLDHATLVSMLANREPIDEVIRNHANRTYVRPSYSDERF